MSIITMYICICGNVSEKQLLEAIEDGIINAAEDLCQLYVGVCCGTCVDAAEDLVQKVMAEGGGIEPQAR